MAGQGGTWVDRVIASAPKVDHAVEGVAFVDLDAGAIVAANPALRDLLGLSGELPITLDALVDAGRLARPDVDELRRRTARVGSAGSWTMALRFHRADGATVDLDLCCALVRQLTGPGCVLQLLAQLPDRVAEVTRFPVPASAPATFFDFYDLDMHLRATDPRLVEYGADPSAQIGMLTLVIVHPEDQAVAFDAISELVEKEGSTAEYTVRIVGPRGVYVPINVHIVRMIGDGEPRLLGAVRPLSMMRRPLPEEVLTERECQVVHALFAGWRVPTLAVRDGVSTKTIRNQLSVIYKKLEVTSQSEMLLQFFPPSNLRAPRTDAALDPNWHDEESGPV